jgi:hypothetical protein
MGEEDQDCEQFSGEIDAHDRAETGDTATLFSTPSCSRATTRTTGVETGSLGPCSGNVNRPAEGDESSPQCWTVS